MPQPLKATTRLFFLALAALLVPPLRAQPLIVADPAMPAHPHSVVIRAGALQRREVQVQKLLRQATGEARRNAALFGVGAVTWVVGTGGGALIGSQIDGREVHLPLFTMSFGYLGGAVGTPVAVHYANGRRGKLWLGLLTSVGADLAGGAVLGYSEVHGNAQYGLGAALVAAKVAGVVAVERATERRR